LVSEKGDYRFIADKSGVNLYWLQKFAIGAIPNPGVQNIAKLESFFCGSDSDAA
jgi:hypothetical protein